MFRREGLRFIGAHAGALGLEFKGLVPEKFETTSRQSLHDRPVLIVQVFMLIMRTAVGIGLSLKNRKDMT